MKQLEIPFEFIDDLNKIKLYKVDDWVLISTKESDPIPSKNANGRYKFVVNIVNNKVHISADPEAKVLKHDFDYAKKLNIEDYIGLSNSLKAKRLVLNKKKIELYGIPYSLGENP